MAKALPSVELSEAFAAFNEVAGSLEGSYNLLSQEAARLRQELEIKNQENERMRAHLVSILENLPCGVIVVSPQGDLRLANPEARRLLDLSAATLSVLQQVAPGGEREIDVGERRIGVTRTHRDGFGIVLIREVSQMAFLLANEIRNPIASLELFAGLLADSVDRHPETRQWVDHLQTGLRQISATVHNTLNYHCMPIPRISGVNVTRLLRETLQFLRPVARQKGMRVELNADPRPSEVAAEAHSLQQVFFNLALNAFRAMSHGGVLEMSTHPEERFLQVAFADQGCGIAAEDLKRIFEPGFSVNHSGPGLGLAVSQRIVEQFGGEITVTSGPGQGSKFVVSLPYQTAGATVGVAA